MAQDYSFEDIKKFQLGQVEAFERIMRAEGPRLLNYIKCQVRRVEIAEEIFQETCLRLWENRESLRQPAQFLGWMYQIARSVVFHVLRRKEWSLNIQLFSELADWPEFESNDKDARNTAELKRLKYILSQEIQALDQEARELILLRFMTEMKIVEIATALNMSVGSVSMKLASSLKKMRAALREQGIEIRSFYL